MTPTHSTAGGRTANVGERITTRYFGGYESTRVVQVHKTYYVVSRFSGSTTDILPKDHVEKIFDVDNNEVCSAATAGPHPALAKTGGAA